MKEEVYSKKASSYISTLCGVKPNRRTGSAGNREATAFFAKTVQEFGYDVDTKPFDCLDYARGEVTLVSGGSSFEVFGSPYSMGCNVSSGLLVAAAFEELEISQCENKLLLLRGALCAEQLMPKNFVFYNPEHHQNIIALLERKNPAAIITATERNPDMVGALYPFPLITDGDFDIPVAYCSDDVGDEIARKTGADFHLLIKGERIPSTASNVIAHKNPGAQKKIVVTAHIDAYEDTPGASDNASGTAVLLLLAELLQSYHGELGIEIAAFNGEDHYSVGGQMDYLDRYGSAFGDIEVVINVDDVGYIKGRSAYSHYGCPAHILEAMEHAFGDYPSLVAGEPWFNGDHMIFVQSGVPSIAFTAELMPELMVTVTHTSADTPDLVDPDRLVEVAKALESLVRRL